MVAEVPALPGCVSPGLDEKEALTNVKEAMTAWLWAEDQKSLDSFPESQSGNLVSVGSHLDLTKSASTASLSIPQHKELSVGTLRALIRSAGVTVDEFVKLL